MAFHYYCIVIFTLLKSTQLFVIHPYLMQWPIGLTFTFSSGSSSNLFHLNKILLETSTDVCCISAYAEKPSIDVSKIKDITVKAGQPIKIALPLKGWPVPTANWQNGDNDIVKDDRTNIEVLLCF